jgi:hypothetical protein
VGVNLVAVVLLVIQFLNGGLLHLHEYMVDFQGTSKVGF